MRPLVTVGTIAVALSAFSAVAQPPPASQSAAPQLTPAEQAAGWTLLFDGKDTAAWRGYRHKAFPAQSWTVVDGCLKTVAGGAGSDLITLDQYGDFELTLEWKVAEKGNSGILYRVTETHDETWQTGPEYQILDDRGAQEAPDSPHSAGAMFDLYPAAAGKVSKPAGEFNQARIRLQGGVVQHWLNGVKLVECRLDGPEWTQRIAASKFRDYEGFGLQPRGHIALQHHGDEVWFRNIRVRDLAAALPGEVRLFNGKDLQGWTACLPEGKKMEDVWSVADGILICKGQPIGYVRTAADYTNYVLKLEWRFNPITQQAGNSGVLLRILGPDKVWPRCIEAQLESGNAGDFWNIDEFPMKADPARTQGRNTKKLRGAERPVGEWNEYEIIVDHGTVTLDVNGEVLNEASEVLETPGKIGLQSEGAEIHFRNIRLAPIP
jgi:hypothetical protein